MQFGKCKRTDGRAGANIGRPKCSLSLLCTSVRLKPSPPRNSGIAFVPEECSAGALSPCVLSFSGLNHAGSSVGETKRRGRVRVELRSAVLFRFAESDHRRVVTPRFAAIEREGGGLVYNPWPQSRYAWQVVVGDSRVKCRCCSRRRCAAQPTDMDVVAADRIRGINRSHCQNSESRSRSPRRCGYLACNRASRLG